VRFVLTSLARSQPLEFPKQKFSSLGRVGNECLYFFGFFFSIDSGSSLSFKQFLASPGVACSQSGACRLWQRRAENDNYDNSCTSNRQSATAYGSVDAACPNHLVSADEPAARAACASASADSFE
jgi:hypothetical protein